MISTDSMLSVSACILTPQTRSMTVYDATATASDGELLHDNRVSMEHAGPVHHLAQVPDARILEQLADILGCDLRTSRFERRCRHTRRRTKGYCKWHARGVVDHVSDAVDTADIADLMRVTDGSYGPMDHSQAGELRRDEHRRFDMNMSIDQARHDVLLGRGFGDLLNGHNALTFYRHDARICPPGINVNDHSTNVLGFHE
jgi:hypothetical protein